MITAAVISPRAACVPAARRYSVVSRFEVAVPDDALTEEDEDILNYDDIDDPDAFA